LVAFAATAASSRACSASRGIDSLGHRRCLTYGVAVTLKGFGVVGVHINIDVHVQARFGQLERVTELPYAAGTLWVVEGSEVWR